MIPKKLKSAKPRINLRLTIALVEGRLRKVFMAADDMAEHQLAKREYKAGDEVGADLKKPRDPVKFRRAHKLGQLLIENADDFAHYTDAHDVLKRLQLESGVWCDETAIRLEGIGMVMHRQALSLAFDEMEDGEFNKGYAQLSQFIITKYWPGLEAWQIEQMAGLVGLAA